MAYDKGKIFTDSKSLISEHKLFFIEDIVSFLPLSKTTFYDFFPPESDELNELKNLLDKNRISVKTSMRRKWQDAESASLQIALMKLICTDEEAHRLNGTKTVNENVNTNVAVLTNDPFNEADNSPAQDNGTT